MTGNLVWVFSLCSLLWSISCWRYIKRIERERAANRDRETEAAIAAEVKARDEFLFRTVDAAGKIANFSAQMNSQNASEQLPSLRKCATDLYAALDAVEDNDRFGWLSNASNFRLILGYIMTDPTDIWLDKLLDNIANGGTDPDKDKLLTGMYSSTRQCHAFLTAHVSPFSILPCEKLAEVIEAIDTIWEKEAVLRAADAAGAIANFFAQMNSQNASKQLPSLRVCADELHAVLDAVEKKDGDGWLSGVSNFLVLLYNIKTKPTLQANHFVDEEKLLEGMCSSATQCRAFLRKMGTSPDDDGLTAVIDTLCGTAPAEQPEGEEEDVEEL
jgi:hypothetical protein